MLVRKALLILSGLGILLSSCAAKKKVAEPVVANTAFVTVAPAAVRHVPAAFDETGTFVADESS